MRLSAVSLFDSIRVAVAGMALWAACGQAQALVLKVGVYDNPPKVFSDSQGKATGSLVELLEAMAAVEGWSLEFVPCEWQNCLQALEKGELDLMPDVAATDERRRRFNFHGTAALHSWSQLYRRSAIRIDSIQDLKGRRVAVLAGGIQASSLHNLLQSFQVPAELVPVPTVSEAFRQLAAGEVDAAASSYHFGDFRAAELGLVATPVVFEPSPLFYAAPKGRHEGVLKAIDQWLNTWLGDDQSPYFEVMRRWRAPTTNSKVPSWTWQALAALSVLGGLLGVSVFGLRRAVRKATRDLTQTNAHLTATLRTLPDLLFELDEEGTYLAVHTPNAGLLAAPAPDLLGHQVSGVLPRLAAERVMATLALAQRQGHTSGQVIELETQEGKRWFELSASKKGLNAAGKWTYILLSRDITPRHVAEMQARQLARLYAALSEASEAARTSPTVDVLLGKVCVAAVDQEECTLAWAGLLQPGEEVLRPTVHHGEGEAFVADMALPLYRNNADLQGPTAHALATDQPFWCHDFMREDRLREWWGESKRFGWQSMAALPLHAGGAVCGALVLYSRRTNQFDAQARELLERLAQTVDDGLERLRQEADRTRLQQDLMLNEAKFRHLTESITDVIWTLDPHTLRFTYVSPSVQRMRGFTPEEVMALPMDAALTPESAARVRAQIQQHLADFETGLRTSAHQNVSELLQPCKDGSSVWTEVVTTYGRNPATGEVEIRGVSRNISERRRAEERIRHLVEFDQLSGLLSRVSLQQRMWTVLQDAHAAGQQVALLMLDIDQFKNVNDALGHRVGDQVLVETANRLRHLCRSSDLLCRMGADEFVAVIPNLDTDATTELVRSMLAAMRQPFVIDHHEVRSSCSVGIALFPTDAHDAEELLRKADAALARCKAEGRNDYRYFTAAMQAQSDRLLALSSALAEAIERQQLQVHYQAQVDLSTGRLVGTEALLRWTHPQWGVVSPAEFIPVAESTGLILPIGQWVLEQSVRDARTWLDAGRPVRVAVNLSAIQFRHAGLVADLEQLLATSGLPAQWLELELTESLTMGDPEQAIATLQALHGLGLRLSVDDFGTGYSSLNYLKRLPVDTIKIDQSFVRDIGVDTEDEHIIRAIIQLAKALNLVTLAEGVETAAQARFLLNQGCDHMQGWRVHRACSAADFAAFVAGYQPVPPSA